jgi:quinoprotein glucose dehydrogenase
MGMISASGTTERCVNQMRITRKQFSRVKVWLGGVAGATLLAMRACVAGNLADDWPCYGHDAGGMRYSPLAQINRDNVAGLKVAWVYHAGDISDGHGKRKRSGLETTPIMVDGTLFLTTGFNRVIALDPETGRERWSYDPKTKLSWNYGDGLINRGVATWLDPSQESATSVPSSRHPRRRIYEATLDARLIALDAATGKPCADFGRGGQVSLRNVARYIKGQYHMTSPPAVIDDLVVVGSSIDDNTKADMPSGVVRAFDARTGALRWSWEPLLPPVQRAGGNHTATTWRTGAGNTWSIMSVDLARDLIFVPTGSASPDYYGGLRPGDNKWADSVVALNARTGALVWGFQLVHHDLWDYDCASPPLLATIKHNGKDVPVVVQGNKTGFLYVLDRDTGAPVFGVEERPAPQSDVPGECASATQPFPLAPPALVPQSFSLEDTWGLTAEERQANRARLAPLRNEGIFTPPSLQGSLVIPGNVGGMNWSGYALDPTRSLLIVNVNNLPAKIRLVPRAEFLDHKRRTEKGDYTEQWGTPYGLFRRLVLGPSGLPCGPPPWGELAAVDLSDGTIRWRVPLGSMQDFGGTHPPVPPGVPSLGGPIVTAGGLIFIAGTLDSFIRAFDIETGKEIWKAKLPASGGATPMTYQLSPGGKQYLVIAAGGHPKVTEESQSDAIVAFALP